MRWPLLLGALPWIVLAQNSAAPLQAPAGNGFWSLPGGFVGSGQCRACHAPQSKDFHLNSMSRALERIEGCAILKAGAPFQFTVNGYSYSIVRAGNKMMYRVTQGQESFEAPLEYAFGQGKAGQTYVFTVDGHFYETRVSYYDQLKGLALTVGAINANPANLREAAGRIMAGHEARDCFGCHTTGARRGQTLQLTDFEPGVQCEACHGPGGAHIDSVKAGSPAPGSIRSLKHMDPQETNEACGSCHRTWEAVMQMGIKGINTARFPAYRITSSPCFSLTDRRIACTACHNPHQPLIADDKFYDAKCTACHNKTNAAIKKATCPVATQACTSCHMQRVEPAESHHAFPDHWIRIVHSKADYPE